MALVTPDVMLNSIMGKVYNILTNGDDTVPRSEDNFLSWATPGIPLDPEDYRFLRQGLTGIVRKSVLDELRTEGPDNTGAGGPEITPAFLESLRATDAGQLYMQAENFARMVDFVPDLAGTTNNQFASLSVMNNEGTLSDRYKQVLRMSQVMKSVLAPAVLAELEQFRAKLQKPERSVTDSFGTVTTFPPEETKFALDYRTKQAAFDKAALEYNTRRIDALTAENQRAVHYWALNAQILRNSVRTALADWIATGNKGEYERIAAFMDQVMMRDMSVLKQEYIEALTNSRLTGAVSGSDFYFTSAVPAGFVNDTGWTEFTFDSSDFNNSANSSYKITSSKTGAAGGYLGIFGGSGSVSTADSEAQSNVKFDSETFKMKFKIAQVQIVRPWFKTGYLMSKSWRMHPDSSGSGANEMISDGASPAKGLLPAYPTAMIVIRDLSLSASNAQGLSDTHSKWQSLSGSGGGYVHWGMFHLGGTHGRKKESGERSSNYHYDSQSETMDVDGMQVIGFKCHVFPKRPDPLSSITEWI